MSGTKILQKPLSEYISTVLDDNELRAYSNVAKKIKFAPSILISAQLRAFFVEKNIKIFDIKEVWNYLNRIVPKNNNWYWRPLRKQDAMYIDMMDKKIISNLTDSYMHHYKITETYCLPYNKEIPLRVLTSVNDMIERFDTKIAFFVSDFAIKPSSFMSMGVMGGTDPFIMVTPKTTDTDDDGYRHIDRDIFVFDVWDEPSFS